MNMNPFTPYNIYGIIGYPLGHSMSPLIHTTSFQDHGIPAVLVAFPTPPDEIATLFKSVRLLNIRGLCVTIPHKQSIIPYLDEVTERVKKAGAANLVYWGGDKLCGDNTDIIGFMEPLRLKNQLTASSKVLVLGAGGAARGIVVGLQYLGYSDITVTSVSNDSPKKLANDFDLGIVPWEDRSQVEADLIVNTTPLGMAGKFEDQTAYEQTWFKGKGIAYDIVYTPNDTRFINEANQAGWDTISGLEMFIGQANAQFKIWTGKDLSNSAKQAVIDTLARK